MYTTQNKKLLRHFLIYSSGAIALKIITALCSLLTIKILTPKEFGLLALLNNFTIILPIMLGLGLRQVLGIEFYRLDKTGQKSLITNLISIYLLWSTPTTLILILGQFWINKWVFFGLTTPSILLTAIAICFVSFFSELLFQVLRFQNKALKLTVLQICMATVIASTTIFCVYKLGLGIIGVLFGQLSGQIVAASYGLHSYFNKIGFTISKLQKKTALGYLKTGLPFIPNIICSWILISSNRWILAAYTNLELVGIYSLAESCSLIFQTIITQPMINIYTPYAMKKFYENKNEIEAIDAQQNKFAVVFILFFTTASLLGYLLLKPFAIALLPVKYHLAMPLVPILVTNQIFFAASYIISTKLQFLKKTHLLALVTGVSSTTGIASTILFVSKFGIWGCAISSTFFYFIYLLLVCFLKRQIKS